MTSATAMIESYPRTINLDRSLLAECIRACVDRAQACTACADAGLSEDMVAELTKCIRTGLDRADACEATGRVLSRHTGYDAQLTRAVLEACAQACRSCGDECTWPEQAAPDAVAGHAVPPAAHPSAPIPTGWRWIRPPAPRTSR